MKNVDMNFKVDSRVRHHFKAMAVQMGLTSKDLFILSIFPIFVVYKKEEIGRIKSISDLFSVWDLINVSLTFDEIQSYLIEMGAGHLI